MKACFLLVFLVIFLGFIPIAYGENKARLISPFEQASPGSLVPIGLHIQLKKNWHTYWESPGDIGQAPNLKFLKSQAISAFLWPRPKRIFYQKWIIFGYEEEVLAKSQIKIPKNFKKDHFEVTADFKWLACKKLCIPFEEKLSIKIPVAKSPRYHPKNQKIFSKFEGQYPSSFPLKTQIKKEDNKTFIEITSQTFVDEWLDFFPIDPAFSKKKPLPLEQSHYHLKLPLPSDKIKKKTKALLVFKKTGQEFSSFIPLEETKTSLIYFILAAFLGGLLLNLMPCVWPVLFLKFYNIKKEDQKNWISSSLSYAGGVVFSFLALALALHLLSESAGWGFQMRSPAAVFFLILFFLSLACYFLGLFHFRVKLPFWMKKGPRSFHSFFLGVLAVVSAAPCTAPFMGAAIGYAFLAGTGSIVFIFTSLGLGLALPYVWLCFFPGILRMIESPKSFEKPIKKLMALFMFLTVLWLSYVFLGFYQNPAALKDQPSHFSIVKLDQIRGENRPVLIYFTARWCLTCLVNEQNIFSNKDIKKFLKEQDITLLRGDWTSPNIEIEKTLKKYDRAGIPFTAFFPRGGKAPILLPELLSASHLKKIILQNRP